MVSLADLKKNSGSTLNTLIEASKKANDSFSKGNEDDRFWLPDVDSAGNGKATIRFLPAPNGETLPWVSYYDFAFKAPSGRWYIERSLQSIGQKDPCAEHKNKIWTTDQEFAKTMKRKQNFISNILVINDPSRPENNGKVFLYRYGKKIYDKIQQVLFPDAELGEVANDPTDFWKGQNFHLIIKMTGAGTQRFRSYDDSKFVTPSPIAPDDDEIGKIWASQYSLTDLVAPSTFKTYDELKAKLDSVLSGDDQPVQRQTKAEPEPVKTATRKPVAALEEQVEAKPAATSGGADFDLDSILEGLK